MPLPAAALAIGRAVAGSGGGGFFSRLGDGAWRTSAVFDLAGRSIDSVLPTFQHACTVMVRGGPQADLRRVWYLCASSAFGRMLRSPGLLGGNASMQATWDISGKQAQIEIVYTRNKTAGALSEMSGGGLNLAGKTLRAARDTIKEVFGIPVGGGFGPLADRLSGGVNLRKSPIGLIQVGPDQVTIGSGWPDFLRRSGQSDALAAGSSADPVEGVSFRSQVEAVVNDYRIIVTAPRDRNYRNLLRELPLGVRVGEDFLITGVPHRVIGLFGAVSPNDIVSSPVAVGVSPTLPDDGRIITTGEKTHPGVQPPRPMLDGSTRTSIVALFAAELTTPCYLPDAPPITNTPLYSRGLFVHDSGAEVSYPELGNIVNQTFGEYYPVGGRDESPVFTSDRFPDSDKVGDAYNPEDLEDSRG